MAHRMDTWAHAWAYVPTSGHLVIYMIHSAPNQLGGRIQFNYWSLFPESSSQTGFVQACRLLSSTEKTEPWTSNYLQSLTARQRNTQETIFEDKIRNAWQQRKRSDHHLPRLNTGEVIEASINFQKKSENHKPESHCSERF